MNSARTLTRTDPDSALAVVRRFVPDVPRRLARRIIRLALLRPAHLEILRVLLKGGMTAREISESLLWEHSRVARDLRMLREEGLVRRSTNADRVYSWELVE